MQVRAKASSAKSFDPAALLRRFVNPEPGTPQPFAWVPAYIPELARVRRVAPSAGGLLGRMGSLEVRLAASPADIRKAQALRYKVFYEEMSAVPSAPAAMLRRDADLYDAICDHVLVEDHAALEARPFRRPEPRVVATYRLLRQEMADLNGGFYTAAEFDVEPLVERHPGLRMLELGRSCVLAPYRDKRTIELLWHGVWAYVRRCRVDAMFGCASLDGVDPDRLALPLSFLAQHRLAPEAWRVAARPERRVEMNRLPPEAVDLRRAVHTLPPLIKGYLRLGAWVGDGAVIDRQFGTTDVFVVLPTSNISGRYIDYFGADAGRHAA
jgi:putative hemolysin